MAGKDRKNIAKLLIAKGMDPSCPIAVVENAGFEHGFRFYVRFSGNPEFLLKCFDI